MSKRKPKPAEFCPQCRTPLDLHPPARCIDTWAARLSNRHILPYTLSATAALELVSMLSDVFTIERKGASFSVTVQTLNGGRGKAVCALMPAAITHACIRAMLDAQARQREQTVTAYEKTMQNFGG